MFVRVPIVKLRHRPTNKAQGIAAHRQEHLHGSATGGIETLHRQLFDTAQGEAGHPTGSMERLTTKMKPPTGIWLKLYGKTAWERNYTIFDGRFSHQGNESVGIYS